MSDTLDDWFKREILRHEVILMHFLGRIWPRAHEREDIRQETYVRVYEAARSIRPHSPKAFLFATARHLVADRIRRERIVSIRAGGDSDYQNVLVDELTPERNAAAEQEFARLAHSFDRLTSRCRDVIWLRRVRDIPQREVAARLGLSEKTVEKHLRTGIRLLAQYMRSGVPVRCVTQARSDSERGNEREAQQFDR